MAPGIDRVRNFQDVSNLHEEGIYGEGDRVINRFACRQLIFRSLDVVTIGRKK